MGKVRIAARAIVGRRVSRPGGVRGAILQEFQGSLAPRILRVGRQTAPHAGGALARGLRARVSRRIGGLGIELKSTVRSREGYPYTGVTRFGHRKRWIEPTKAKALRTPWGPRRRVRGYRPSHDWADDTARAAQPHIVRSGQRIGRRLTGGAG